MTVESRDRLPYVDAVLHEVMRITSVAPFGLFHKTRTDIKLGVLPVAVLCNPVSVIINIIPFCRKIQPTLVALITDVELFRTRNDASQSHRCH